MHSYCNVDKMRINDKGDYSMVVGIHLLGVFHSAEVDDRLIIMMMGAVVSTGCGTLLGM